MIIMDVVSTQVREVEKDIKKCDSAGIKKEIWELAKNEMKQIKTCALFLTWNSRMDLISF